MKTGKTPRCERIVSLLPSATEIVYALGLGERLVGVTHECDYPHGIEKLPVCTRPKIEVSGSSLEIDRQVKANLANALSIYEVLDDVLEELLAAPAATERGALQHFAEMLPQNGAIGHKLRPTNVCRSSVGLPHLHRQTPTRRQCITAK